MFLVFDTETTGLPKNWDAPITDTDNWPRMVQLAWQLHDVDGKLISNKNYIIKPEGYTIPYNVVKVHGISTDRAMRDGHDLSFVLEEFNKDLARSTYNVGHNIGFDINIVGSEFYRKEIDSNIAELKVIDTKDDGTDFCKIPGGRGGQYKWPTLTELHTKLFGVPFGDAHDAAYDVDATAKCFFGLVNHKACLPEEILDPEAVIYEAPELEEANFEADEEFRRQFSDLTPTKRNAGLSIEAIADAPFAQLHCHSQFSILQATSQVGAMVNKAKESGMPAIALTDHGNMMAAYHFVRDALKADLKPVVGCEFYVTADRKDKSRKNDGDQIVILAKNKKGYHNLAKLASFAQVEGFYYVPRIDKQILLEYKEDLIITSGGLWGEIPFKILNEGEESAEEALLWWKEHFGEDFYIELNRHGIEEEEVVNDVMLGFARKHGIKYFAANSSYYTNKDQASAHDVLLCVKDADPVSKPKKYIGKRGREFRFGFPNDEFYIKSPEEMKQLFADIPEAILTVGEILDKIEPYELARDVLLPKFDIPDEFKDPRDDEDPSLKIGENAYLRHLTYEGAKKRYDEITDDIRERLDFELSVIQNTGYPGYFLIVQDFTTEARNMGVSVGPGRGSAAGSAVAYCIGITNVDPIKYDLLFERFLNPDRVSLPDIDIDFDDEGRGRVIDYVIKKYGANQVAQIITYGTMAAKSSIRDTARVMELPLQESDRIAKLVPDIKLGKLFGLDDEALADKLKNNADSIAMANELKELSKGEGLDSQVLNQARVLEGSVRNTGIHACGVIITPDDITNFVPVATAKDSDMYCTQFDNSVVEDAGLLKMDFLGLKTLTLIKDAIKNVKETHDVQLVSDDFPIDDTKTYELFQRGETVGIFQYESPGMQKYMRELKPTVFGDLIAMNALYRPGPLEYIPSFIRRKHGEEEITYDLEGMEEYLEETYGITVYQEQVMLLSQKLAGFTKGEADMLRKAMGKKIFALLEKLKPKFINQAMEKGHEKAPLEKVWKDWEAFASYAFNKSHSTCYAWVAYQTAYLKAHYPAEYMASVLSNNMNDIKQVTFFMEECARMGIDVLGPDVNESGVKFTVNQEGQIRFGLGAIKGSGDAAVRAIIGEREENGHYNDLFDFAERVNLKTVNKKTFEALAQAGSFDNLDTFHRRQYLEAPEGEMSLVEKVTKYANKIKEEKESAQVSLFGGGSGEEVPRPKITQMEPYGKIEELKLEKEVVGLFISGHPLDAFKLEIDTFVNCSSNQIPEFKNKDVTVCGAVVGVRKGMTKSGKSYLSAGLEDYEGKIDLFLIGNFAKKYDHLFQEGEFLYAKGRVALNWRKAQEQQYNPEMRISDDDYDFTPSHIDTMESLRKNQLKGILLKMDASLISDEFISQITGLLSKTKAGDKQVKFQFFDGTDGLRTDMISRKFLIDPDDDFMEGIRELKEVEVRVLT